MKARSRVDYIVKIWIGQGVKCDMAKGRSPGEQTLGLGIGKGVGGEAGWSYV